MMKAVASALLVLAAATPALAQPSTQAPMDSEDPIGQTTVAPDPSNPADGSTVPMTAAQPGQPQAVVVVAPHNENWSNVSHINGQLVPVGERGNYIIKDKDINISTNPLGWLFGVYGVSVAKRLSHNVAVRGDVNVFSMNGSQGFEVGASLPIYFKRVFSGPFLEPGIITRSFDNDAGLTMTGPEILFGWQWIFDSGLNVAFAFGAAKDLSTAKTCDEYECYSGDSVQPAGYFRVGYAWGN